MHVNSIVTHYGNKIFGRKWRIVIVYVLKDGPMRFSQIKSFMPDCSVKVLSESLQDLEENHVIVRKQYNTIPVKVTYELNDHVKDYIDVMGRYLEFLHIHLYLHREFYKLPADFIQDLESKLTMKKDT